MQPSTIDLLKRRSSLAAVTTLMVLAVGVAAPADVPEPDAPAAKPELLFDGDQVRIQWGPRQLTASAIPTVERVLLEDRTVNPENGFWKYDWSQAPVDEAKLTVDAANQRAVRAYPWGELRTAYKLDGLHLKMQVEIENKTEKPIANFNVRLMSLDLPNKPDKLKGKKPLIEQALNTPVAVELPAPEGQLFISYDTFSPPLRFGVGHTLDEGRGIYPVVFSGGIHASPIEGLVAPPLGIPTIPAGKTLKVSFSIRFARHDARRHMVLKDFYAEFRRFQQPMLDWPDRRPIGAAFLMSEVGKAPPTFGQKGTNPRRWFSPTMNTVEVDSPQGRSMLRRAMRNLAYNTVRTLKKLDGQGMILWNLEGGFHSTGWVGDPRMLPILSPEIDKAIDDYFNIIRSAGFKTGVTLRQGQLRWNEDRQQWQQGVGNHNPRANPAFDEFDKYLEQHPHEPWWRIYPVAERFSNKIDYAKKRWGCTIFYIDTSLIPRGYGPNQKFSAKVIESHIWRKVREEHPDVLIIPEIAAKGGNPFVGNTAHIAPYGQMEYGRVSPRAGQDWRRDILPDYFGMHYVADGDLWGTRVDRVRELARGMIHITQGWSFSSNNYAVIEYYNQANDYQQRLTTLARRYGLVEHDGPRPYHEPLGHARELHPDVVVADPPAGQQLRVYTASSDDRGNALLALSWLGRPHAPGTVLQADLPGVDVAGQHKHVWDVASGDPISSTAGVDVPSEPVTGLRALYVRGSDQPLPQPRPDGVRLTVSFDQGLAPDAGGGLLEDNGSSPRVASPHGQAVKLTPGGGVAQYSSVPNWYAGTVEFDLKVAASDDQALPLLRFRHHMDTTLSLVRREGKPTLHLATYERNAGLGYWTDTALSPAPDATAPPVLRETHAALPADGKWHHVVLAWTLGQYRIYVDGRMVGMIAHPSMYRWRDGEIFKPGLIVGGGEAGGGAEAHVDSLMLYGYDFDDAQASARKAPMGLQPLPRPADAKPSVWLWGASPQKGDRIAVNLRRTTHGERAWNLKAELFEKTDAGLRKLAAGSVQPMHGVALIKFDYEPGPPPAGALDAGMADDGGNRGGVNDFDLGEAMGGAVKTYVLRITGRAPGDAASREIEFQYGLKEKDVRFW